MKWTVTGYYWDGKNHYVIYENKNGSTIIKNYIY
jgi:hypothetical protein